MLQQTTRDLNHGYLFRRKLCCVMWECVLVADCVVFYINREVCYFVIDLFQ